VFVLGPKLLTQIFKQQQQQQKQQQPQQNKKASIKTIAIAGHRYRDFSYRSRMRYL